MKKTTTFYPKILAQIPIEVVAGIAAQIHPEGGPPWESVREAYLLLDAAEAARKSLAETGTIVRGLGMIRAQHFKEAILAERKQAAQSDPLVKMAHNGEELPVNFSKAVAGFFTKSIKPQSREEKLVLYLSILTSTEDTLRAVQDWGGNLSNLPVFPKRGKEGAEKVVAEWKKGGIPVKDYLSLKANFPLWYEMHKRQTKSEAGKAPKGKQGRVVRRNDKRKGSRAGSFLKALKKKP